MHQLTLENWPIVRLIDYARNPRKNDHAIEQMAGAIREFGFRIPIIAKSTGDVVDGHLRLKAARQLGLETVADHVVPLKDGGERLDWANLAALCVADHNAKTARETAVKRKE